MDRFISLFSYVIGRRVMMNERGLRLVYCDQNAPYSDLLRRTKLTTLLNKRLQSTDTLMYKIKNDLAPQIVQSIFRQGQLIRSYNLRNNNFRPHRFNTKHHGKSSLRYFGPYLWSKLDHKFRSQPSVGSFIRAICNTNVEDIIKKCKNCVTFQVSSLILRFISSYFNSLDYIY